MESRQRQATSAPPQSRSSTYTGCDEKTLLIGCQTNQREAWQEFIDRFTNLIYYVIKVRCGYRSQEDAEEIYQCVFVKLLKSIQSLKDDTKLRSWLLAVTWNECIDFSRKRKVLSRFFVPDEDLVVPVSLDQEYYVGLREMLTMFQTAFQRISPKSQELLAFKHRGASVDEIADRMNIPKGSIYYNHKKACKELSTVLRDMKFDYGEFQQAFPQFLLPLE